MLDIKELKDTVIEFRSTTCGLCRKMTPLVSKLLKDTQISFIEIFIDDEDEEENIELAESFNVSSLPTFIHIVEGKRVGEAVGFHNLEEMKRLLMV